MVLTWRLPPTLQPLYFIAKVHAVIKQSLGIVCPPVTNYTLLFVFTSGLKLGTLLAPGRWWDFSVKQGWFIAEFCRSFVVLRFKAYWFLTHTMGCGFWIWSCSMILRFCWCSIVIHIRVKIYKTIILSVVLYGCETWCLTLWEEDNLKLLNVFKNNFRIQL